MDDDRWTLDRPGDILHRQYQIQKDSPEPSRLDLHILFMAVLRDRMQVTTAKNEDGTYTHTVTFD